MSTAAPRPDGEAPLRILFANALLKRRTGCELYTYELALELLRLGHLPMVFASQRGRLADQLAERGIEVVTRLSLLSSPPDLIQGHQHVETLLAVRQFPTVPAIHVCHDHVAWFDRPPRHPRIVRHFGVSRLCVERALRAGVPADRVSSLLNWVDLRRFSPRPALPPRPSRALLFSNYASHDGYLPMVAEACRRAALTLDVVGSSAGNPNDCPESLLGRYDLVFAKARAAMEAMACGCAVVLCDFGGVGPLVTAAEFARLRPLNFGFQALTGQLRAEALLEQIERYDAGDAARVCALLRSQASLEDAARALVHTYREILDAWRRAPVPATRELRMGLGLAGAGLLAKALRGWIEWKQRPGTVAFRRTPAGQALVRARNRLRGRG